MAQLPCEIVAKLQPAEATDAALRRAIRNPTDMTQLLPGYLFPFARRAGAMGRDPARAAHGRAP
jgi:hypothetical protein